MDRWEIEARVGEGMILFPDQLEIVEAVRDKWKQGCKSLLLQSPTGSGKTAMATHIIRSAVAKGKRVGFTAPRRELLKQTSETFSSLGIMHGFIAAGYAHNPYSRVYLGMVDTMARRLDKLPDLDLLIVDETHYGEGSLGAVIEEYRKRGAWILGLSATPWKLSGKGLGVWYADMVQGRSIRWLIENKRLSDYRFFRGKTKPDFSKIKVTAGDYAKGEIADFMEQQGVIIGDCVRDYQQRAMHRLHVVRCASVKHSQMTAESFNAAGIIARHVDGTTPDDEMRRIIRGYARREINVLTFCDLLNFGFDLSQASGMDVCIESGSDLKPSKSLAGQLQYWGRMLRMKEYPALIMDHVNNYIEHGLPCDEREWSLDDRSQWKKSSERAMPTRQCPNCFAVHAPAPVCPECGHVYTVKPRQVDTVDGEMEEITSADIPPRQQQGMAGDLESLIKLGRNRGYASPEVWAAKIISARMIKARKNAKA